MAFPSPQKSLDETVGSLQLATSRPACMPTAPKAAVVNPTCASPMKLSSSPKRVRLGWAADMHSPTSPGTTPKKDADSGDDLLFEEVEQQPEKHQERTSVLEELCFGTVAHASGWTAPSTPPFHHPASLPPAESLPAVAAPKVSDEEPSSPPPLAAAARAQDPGQEVPKAESVPEAEAAPETEAAAAPEAEAAAVPDAKTAAAAAAAETAAAAAAGASGPKVDKMKIPQRPEKLFKKVMLPKLAEGGTVDFTEFCWWSGPHSA